jgi:hypothetical protein
MIYMSIWKSFLGVVAVAICMLFAGQYAVAADYCFELENICGKNITDLHINLLSPVDGITAIQSPPGWTGQIVFDGGGVEWQTDGAGIPEGNSLGGFCFTVDAAEVTFQWVVSRAPSGHFGPTHTTTWTSGGGTRKLQESLGECYLPSITEYGMICLLLLMIVSAVWSLRWKRRVTD